MERLIDAVQPANIADEFARWGDVASQRQQQSLIDMRIQREQEDAPINRQLKQAQASNYNTQADLSSSKAQFKKMAMGGQIAKVIKSNVMQSGVTPDSPNFPQVLEQISGPYRQIISKVFGHPDDPTKPVDWGAINSMADFDQVTQSREYHPPVATTEGYLKFGNNGFEPMKNAQGKPYLPSTADPSMAGQMALERSKNQIKKYTGPDQRESFATQGQLAGISNQQPNWQPVQDVQSEIAQLQQTDPQAAAQLQAMSDRQPQGPMKGPTPAEKTMSVETAKNAADLDKKRLESEQSKVLGAGKTSDTLNEMMRYLYQGGVQTRDASGRLAPPDQQMIPGTGPIDRAGILGQNVGIHNDKASNFEAVRRLGNKLALDALGGKLGAQISNADVEFIKRQVGILDNPQDLKTFYNSVADIEERVNKIQSESNQPTQKKGDIHSQADAILRGQ